MLTGATGMPWTDELALGLALEKERLWSWKLNNDCRDGTCGGRRNGFPAGKDPSANAGGAGLIPKSERSPGEGSGNPLQ